MTEERLYWLAFSAFKGIGVKRFALLKNYFGSAKKAWQAPQRELLPTGLSRRLVSELISFRQDFSPEKYYQDLQKNQTKTCFLDSDYPVNLKAIEDAPFVLYYQGSLDFNNRNLLAVVGTRRMTAYGAQAAESLVTELSANGLTIVSGLARGIDTIAHRSALSSSGKTIAVLGSGLKVIYPPENTYLARKIIDSGGAVISEFPPLTNPFPGNFPQRNRLISGLSLGTVVIEAGERSGSLITARLAAEQGREVFAVPGPITSPNTIGPANLIKYGAKLVFKPTDIFEEINLSVPGKSPTKIKADSQEEGLILSLLELENKHIDQIVKESGLTVAKIAGLLTMMEIKGKIKALGEMNYGLST